MNIYEKLGAIQTRLKAPKSQYNSFGKYNYRNCEDILEALKPFLTETKTSLTINDEVVLIGTRYYIKASVVLYDNESEASVNSTAYAREEETKKGMDGSQITGAASSYARKYALNGMFAIDDTKDADTPNGKSDGNNAPPKQPARQDNRITKEQATMLYNKLVEYAGTPELAQVTMQSITGKRNTAELTQKDFEEAMAEIQKRISEKSNAN